MLKLLILAVVVAVAVADLDSQWAVFKANHAKKYESPVIEKIRKSIWKDNMELVEKHNKLYSHGLKSYYMGENEYSDLTHSEFVARMNGYRMVVKDVQPSKSVASNVSLAGTIDWRQEGYVTEVKHQGKCGCCWAFSATGSIEGQHYKATKKLVSLSESQLVDCSGSYGNKGCEGGDMDKAFRYVIANKGIDTEESYPYTPEDGTCKYNPRTIGATISKFRDVIRGSEAALQVAVAREGPISVGIDASVKSFQSYKGGVYDEPSCSNTHLDHAVLVVGYGTDQSQDYWLVKNSWGKTWGLDGYIKMSRNKDNQCGIATRASYPIV